MKKIVLLLTVLFLASCTAKHTVKMYEAKQATIQAGKIEQATAATLAYQACQKDANPGLCVAFFTMSNNQKPADNNAIPHLGNPGLDLAKTLLQVAGGGYGQYLSNKTAEAAYNAISGTAIGVAGSNQSINVGGDYMNGDITTTTTTTTTTSTDNSVTVGGDMIEGNPGHVGDDNSVTDNSVNNSNNPDNSVDNSTGGTGNEGDNQGGGTRNPSGDPECQGVGPLPPHCNG